MEAEVRTKDYVVSIKIDEHAESPRTWMESFGTMVCWHRRYSLGDKHNFQEPEDFDLTTDDHVILPLFLYDHSGITMSTSSFSCRWDSGQVGWTYISHEKIKEEYGEVNDETLERAKNVLESEVELYDHYLRGEVYGFTIQKKVYDAEQNEVKLEHEDSCWGFYGDVKDNGILDAIADYDKELRKAVAEQLGIKVEVA